MELLKEVAFIYRLSPKAGSSIPFATKITQHRLILCAVLNFSLKIPGNKHQVW